MTAQLPFERSPAEMNRIAKAARVGRFMTEDAEVGRWRLKHFTINEAHFRHSAAVAIAQGGPQGEMRLERTIPPGEYVTLVRKATKGEMEDIRDEKTVDSFVPGDEDWHSGYVPIMSDTPSEIFEHGHAFRNAHGRVLITGLGLGCLVAALLSTEEVKEIVVVEIDRDVIELVGKYYANEPRVTIVWDDAIRFASRLAAGDVAVEPLKFQHAGDPLSDERVMDSALTGRDTSGRQAQEQEAPHHLNLSELLRWKQPALQQIANPGDIDSGPRSPDDSRVATELGGFGVDRTAELTTHFVKEWSVVVPCRDLSARSESTAPVADDTEVAVTEEVPAKLSGPNRVDESSVDIPGMHEGLEFTYHWADIWSHISPRNLDDDTLAEHGISYETMFEMYAPFVDVQGAWAYPEALKMRMVEEEERERLHEWTRNFIAEEDPKTREDMLVSFHIHRHFPQIPLGEIIPPEVRKFFEEHMDIREGVRQQMSERDMVTDLAQLLDEEVEHPMEPMHRPNEDPEANVA